MLKRSLMIVCAIVGTMGGVTAEDWTVGDGGSAIAIANEGVGQNYIFHNDGVDSSIRVVVKDKDGETVTTVLLPRCNDVTVGVPKGESATVKDVPTPDSDSDGASGTYTPQGG